MTLSWKVTSSVLVWFYQHFRGIRFLWFEVLTKLHEIPAQKTAIFIAVAARTQHDTQCTCKRKNHARSCNHFCRAKPLSIMYSECVFVAFLIQPADPTRRIIWPSVACLALRYFFPPLSHNLHDFRNNVTELKICFMFSLQLFFETFLILQRIKRYRITVHSIHVNKVPVILVRF
jgi:hypothetical protein